MAKTLVALGTAAAICAAALTTPTPAAAQPWVAPVIVGSVIAGGFVGAAVASSPHYYSGYASYDYPACNCPPPADPYVYAPRVYYQPYAQPYYQGYAQPYYQRYARPYARPYYQRNASYRPYDRPYVRPYSPSVRDLSTPLSAGSQRASGLRGSP